MNEVFNWIIGWFVITSFFAWCYGTTVKGIFNFMPHETRRIAVEIHSKYD